MRQVAARQLILLYFSFLDGLVMAIYIPPKCLYDHFNAIPAIIDRTPPTILVVTAMVMA